MKFNLIVLRPQCFFNELPDFEEVQHMQYVALGIEAKDLIEAGRNACKEAYKADLAAIKRYIKYVSPIIEPDFDLRKISPANYTVLGNFAEREDYQMWLNGDRP